MKFEPAVYSTVQLAMGGVFALLGVMLCIEYNVVFQNGTEVPVSLLTMLVALLLMKDAVAMIMSGILSGRD